MEARYYITPEEYAIAEANGLNKNLVNQRVRIMDWPKEKAITEPVKNREKKFSDDVIKKAEENGVTYHLLCERVRHGWSIEKATETPPLSHHECGINSGKKKRKYPLEYAELAKKNGISYSAFTQRVLKGMSFEEAATLPQLTGSEIGKRAAMIREEKRKRGELNARSKGY